MGLQCTEKEACATLPALWEERGKGHRIAFYGRESVLHVISLTADRWRWGTLFFGWVPGVPVFWGY